MPAITVFLVVLSSSAKPDKLSRANISSKRSSPKFRAFFRASSTVFSSAWTASISSSGISCFVRADVVRLRSKTSFCRFSWCCFTFCTFRFAATCDLVRFNGGSSSVSSELAELPTSASEPGPTSEFAAMDRQSSTTLSRRWIKRCLFATPARSPLAGGVAMISCTDDRAPSRAFCKAALGSCSRSSACCNWLLQCLLRSSSMLASATPSG
mmetsp:Transcript_5549/g.9901  ORF Transcript_5549/g.9901 Transcript_5549/m.9901 type:complete len:211 (+) Transcript_5549:934-1566(+)